MTARESARSSSTRSSLIALGYPLGLYMARVYGERFRRQRSAGCERRARLLPARPHRRAKEQDWKSYAKTVLVFSVVFWACSTRSSGCRGISSSTRIT